MASPETRHDFAGGIHSAQAKETEAIVAIGEWALRTACRDAAGGNIPGTVAVNLSPVQFSRDDLAEVIHAILLETGLSPRRLGAVPDRFGDRLRGPHAVGQVRVRQSQRDRRLRLRRERDDCAGQHWGLSRNVRPPRRPCRQVVTWLRPARLDL